MGCMLHRMGRTTQALGMLDGTLALYKLANNEEGESAVLDHLATQRSILGDFAHTQLHRNSVASHGPLMAAAEKLDEVYRLPSVNTSGAKRMMKGYTNSVEYALVLLREGNDLLTSRQPSQALTSFRDSESLFRKLLPPGHPLLADALLGKWDALTAMGGGDGAVRAAEAAFFAVRRRSQAVCAGPGCVRKLGSDEFLEQCAGCLRTYYCGKACQTADWKAGHKAECEELAAAADTELNPFRAVDALCGKLDMMRIRRM